MRVLISEQLTPWRKFHVWRWRYQRYLHMSGQWKNGIQHEKPLRVLLYNNHHRSSDVRTLHTVSPPCGIHIFHHNISDTALFTDEIYSIIIPVIGQSLSLNRFIYKQYYDWRCLHEHHSSKSEVSQDTVNLPVPRTTASIIQIQFLHQKDYPLLRNHLAKPTSNTYETETHRSPSSTTMVLPPSGGGGTSESIYPHAAEFARLITPSESADLINIVQDCLDLEGRGRPSINAKGAITHIGNRQNWVTPDRLGRPFRDKTLDVREQVAAKTEDGVCILVDLGMRLRMKRDW